MKCSKCGTINGQSARFCRHCGSPMMMFWLSRYMPVRNYKIKNNIKCQILCYFLWVPCMFALLGSISNFIFDGGSNTIMAIGDIVVCLFVGILFLYLYLKYFSIYCFRNKLRKKRKELSDSDFVEINAQNGRFCIIARDDFCRFGLFDNEKVKVVWPMVFEKLTWHSYGFTLLGKKDGKYMMIDINGNAVSEV